MISRPYGNQYVRSGSAFMAKGEAVTGHAHRFDHVTVVTAGRLLVELLDGEGPDAKPLKQRAIDPANELLPFILIQAGRIHRLTALMDGTQYHCFYLHRDPVTGEPLDTWNGCQDITAV